MRRCKADLSHGLTKKDRIDDIVEGIKDNGRYGGDGELEHESTDGRRAHASDFVLSPVLALLELGLPGRGGICFMFIHMR